MTRIQSNSQSRVGLAPADMAISATKVARGRETAVSGPWGWLPAIALVGSIGLLGISVANNLSGAGVQGVEPLFWLGLTLIVAPVAARLLGGRAGRLERLGLALLFGMDLYLVKFMQSPYAFTYSDELLHLFNANQIVETGRLFTPNPILPPSALYPGLEAVTTALMRLTGLDTFGAGLVVIGLGRFMLMLALFLLYEQLTGSARVASLASMLYAGSANFLYWSAQFSYESLALPLVVIALYAVARREAGRERAERVGLTIVALLLIVSVVVTHHISSYFLAASLVAWAVLSSPARTAVFGWVERRLGGLSATRLGQRIQPLGRRLIGRAAWPAPAQGAATGGPGGLAVFAVVAVLLWLVYVASLTLTYLSPLFSKALLSLTQMIAGEESGRALFQPSTGGYVAPNWERVVGLGAVVLCLLGLPFGLREVWRRRLHHPFVLLLAGAAVAYFAMLGLRLNSAAWEISNRSGDFLFIGLALVLAMARFPVWPVVRRLLRPLLTGAVVVILSGGVIAGWPPQLRLAQVYQVVAGGQRLDPAGLAAAKWARAELGPHRRIAAEAADAIYLLAYGDQNVQTGRQYSIQSVFEATVLQKWQVNVLQNKQVEYLAVNRRLISNDTMSGIFFDHGGQWPLPANELLPPEVYAKFNDQPLVGRIYDSGDLVIYDVRAWLSASAQP
jgi:hypothetical protein